MRQVELQGVLAQKRLAGPRITELNLRGRLADIAAQQCPQHASTNDEAIAIRQKPKPARALLFRGAQKLPETGNLFLRAIQGNPPDVDLVVGQLPNPTRLLPVPAWP